MCLSCTGLTENDCIECTVGLTKMITAGEVSCLFDCNMEDPTCLDSFTNAFFENADNLCVQCSPTCCECIDATTCVTCNFGFYAVYDQEFNLLECTSTCVDGYYPDVSWNECTPCNDACLTCTGPEHLDCTACHPDFYSNGTYSCVGSCDAGFLNDIPNMDCVPCTSGCDKCN
jgi:proprotein convertase subtilisin/kexin type 5